jgi:hypothetical protein
MPILQVGGAEALMLVNKGYTIHRMASGKTEVWAPGSYLCGFMTQKSYRLYLRLRRSVKAKSSERR